MKTYSKLLETIDGEQLHSNEFIEINKSLMAFSGPLTQQDYDFFWGCMSIYAKYNENHFDDYLRLRMNLHGDFSHGIDAWFQHEVKFFLGSPEETFLHIVDSLQFFEIEAYHGIPISAFTDARNHLNLYAQIARNEVQQSYQKKSIDAINQKIENYFNFSSYSDAYFTEQFNLIRGHHADNAFLIDDAIALSKNSPNATYIVLFKQGNKVCAVTKTTRLLSHIEKKHSRYNADRVAFASINSAYADDLVIALLDYFSIMPSKVRITTENRKYVDLNSAIFVYQRSLSISKKRIHSTIENSSIRTIETSSGQILLDKVMLHNALFHQ